ncbi:hypothetical protein ACS0TY_019834 [Phlomoides rotata]
MVVCRRFINTRLMVIYSTKNWRSIDEDLDRSNFGSGENIPDRTKKHQEHFIFCWSGQPLKRKHLSSFTLPRLEELQAAGTR